VVSNTSLFAADRAKPIFNSYLPEWNAGYRLLTRRVFCFHCAFTPLTAAFNEAMNLLLFLDFSSRPVAAMRLYALAEKLALTYVFAPFYAKPHSQIKASGKQLQFLNFSRQRISTIPQAFRSQMAMPVAEFHRLSNQYLFKIDLCILCYVAFTRF
jgi:hypothetical protein